MPHPVAWVPAEQVRHASTAAKSKGSDYPTGTEVKTLCGLNVIAVNSDVAWLWPTCANCYTAAREKTNSAR